MRILCPKGNVLHTDTMMALALEFVPLLSTSLETIDDKQIRIATDTDYIVLPEIWENWAYSFALANRLILRLTSLIEMGVLTNLNSINESITKWFGPDIERINTDSLGELVKVLESIHHHLDLRYQTNLADQIFSACKVDAKVLGSTKEELETEGMYSSDFDIIFNEVPKSYLRVAISDLPGQFFDLYLPYNQVEVDVFYEIINKSNIQLETHPESDVADFITSSTNLIDWFNEVFSFYRLKLKIDTYREIKAVEKDNEDFISQVETFDEIIREISENVDDSADKNYFLLNKISGILNAYGYEQTILHAVSDLNDFTLSTDQSGYFIYLV